MWFRVSVLVRPSQADYPKTSNEILNLANKLGRGLVRIRGKGSELFDVCFSSSMKCILLFSEAQIYAWLLGHDVVVDGAGWGCGLYGPLFGASLDSNFIELRGEDDNFRCRPIYDHLPTFLISSIIILLVSTVSLAQHIPGQYPYSHS